MSDPDVTGRIEVREPGEQEPRFVAVARDGALARAGAAAWRLIGVGVLLVAALWLIRQLMAVLLPAVIAMMLATLLVPAAAWLRRRGAGPRLATALSVLLALLVIVVAVALIVPPVADRIGGLGSNIEDGVRRVAYSIGGDVAGVSRGDVDRAIDSVVKQLNQNRGQIVGGLVTGATALASAAGALVLILFLAFYMVKDGAGLWRWTVGLVPARQREVGEEFGRRAWAALTTYVHGVVFVATVDAVFIGIGLVALGVDFALPLIVLTFFAAFFPIIGAIGAGLVSVLVTFVSQGVTSAVVIAVIILAVQQLEGNVLYPAVVGPRLSLHPIVVLLAVTLGGTVAGIPGAFLAVPVASVAAAALELRRERLREDADTRVREGESLVVPSLR